MILDNAAACRSLIHAADQIEHASQDIIAVLDGFSEYLVERETEATRQREAFEADLCAIEERWA